MKIPSLNPFKLIPALLDSYRFGKKYGTDLALNIGDNAPDFILPDIYGDLVTFYDLLALNKVILIFYRGNWCPFCNLQLRQYQNTIPQFKAEGAILVAISPAMPDRDLTEEEKADLTFSVLSDIDNQVSKRFTSVLKYEGKSAQHLEAMGIDLHEINQSDSGEVPVPAVFIIGQDRKVLFAKSEGGDYKKRVSPAEVLAALTELK